MSWGIKSGGGGPMSSRAARLSDNRAMNQALRSQTRRGSKKGRGTGRTRPKGGGYRFGNAD